MRESSGGGPGTPQTKDTEAAVEERKSDATSKETVRDAEDDEQGSNARDQRSVPTPDGASDVKKGKQSMLIARMRVARCRVQREHDGVCIQVRIGLASGKFAMR